MWGCVFLFRTFPVSSQEWRCCSTLVKAQNLASGPVFRTHNPYANLNYIYSYLDLTQIAWPFQCFYEQWWFQKRVVARSPYSSFGIHVDDFFCWAYYFNLMSFVCLLVYLSLSMPYIITNHFRVRNVPSSRNGWKLPFSVSPFLSRYIWSIPPTLSLSFPDDR